MLSEKRLQVTPAADLAICLQEAKHIAAGLGQSLHSGHLLLSFFTVPGPAEVLLAEKSMNEDKIIAVMDRHVSEKASIINKVYDYAEQTALRCDTRQVNTLHILVGMLREKESVAFQLLEKAMGSVSPLRNAAMSFVTGVMPRRFQDRLLEAKQAADSTPPTPVVKASKPVVTLPAHNLVVPKKPRPAAKKVTPPVQAKLPEPPPAPKFKVPESSEHLHITMLPTLPPTKLDLDPEQFPWLTSLGRNLTSLALHQKLDPAIGRNSELEQLIDVLGKRRANNHCLVGESGVGKTAIIEGLALKIAEGSPEVASLQDKVIIELDMGRIIAGTSLRGSFSERMQGLKKDVEKARGRIIIFIDEIHTLMGAGGGQESAQDAANELKTALARGVFPCIGATTHDEYKKHIESDPALERRFVKVQVNEPNEELCLEILAGMSPVYAEHHQVRVTQDGIAAAVSLSQRFIHDRKWPGKAIDLLDLTMSRTRRYGKSVVDRKEVALVCADIAKVPYERLALDDASRFLNMERFLEDKVVGHAQPISVVAQTIRRNYAGFSSHRPMGSFLFLGPTGVGKTEMAKALASFLFGNEDALIRIDMSEFLESHSIARLVGAPPGYVGHAEGGQLTEAVRQRPHAVVLLDEIEKAHPDLIPLLLQVLEEGCLTDSKGRKVTFQHTVVILTSNLGAKRFEKGQSKKVGFVANTTLPGSLNDEQKEGVLDDAKAHFSPEVWGRIEAKLVFSPLDLDALMAIARLQVEDANRRLSSARQISFSANKSLLQALATKSLEEKQQGARSIRRLIQQMVENPLSDAILSGDVVDGDKLTLSWKNPDGLKMTKRTSAVLRK